MLQQQQQQQYLSKADIQSNKSNLYLLKDIVNLMLKSLVEMAKYALLCELMPKT